MPKKFMSIMGILVIAALLVPVAVFAGGQNEQGATARERTAATIATGDYTLPMTGIGTQVASSVKAKKQYTIACIVKNSTNPYMLSQLKGVEKAGQDMGINAILMAPTQADSVEEQVKIIEDMIQRKVDGIIIHCADSFGIMPGVRKAEAAGIPIVTIGTPAMKDTLLRTGVNYEETGYVVGKYIAEKLGGRGDVIVLDGPPGAQNANERGAGIVRAFEEFPGIQIVARQPANFRRTDGMNITENLVQRYTNVAAVIGANDESALGALQALRAARMNSVLVAGFDGSIDATAEVESGGLTVTYNTDPYGSGYLAVAYMIQYLDDGSQPPAVFVPFPSEKNDPLITKDNVANYKEEFAWWKANQ
jgi:ABC-type sugar transport system substrate-binding protein